MKRIIILGLLILVISLFSITAVSAAPETCTQYEDFASCTGTSPTCDTYGTSGSCSAASGCSWTEGAPQTTDLYYTGFESGSAGWSDGGSDSGRSSSRSSCRNNGNSGGSYSFHLQDDSSSSYTQRTFDFDGATKVDLAWKAYYDSLESGECLEVKCDGTVVGTFCEGSFSENTWVSQSVEIDSGDCTLDSSVVIRFETEFSSNYDDVWLDCIDVDKTAPDYTCTGDASSCDTYDTDVACTQANGCTSTCDPLACEDVDSCTLDEHCGEGTCEGESVSTGSCGGPGLCFLNPDQSSCNDWAWAGCSWTPGQVIPGACSCPVEPACGDGNVDAGEACDDSNTDDGDGCDSSCQIEYDFGDAEAPFPTLLASNGAGHVISSLFLGASIDSEADGQINGPAAGDDLAGVDDESGIIVSTHIPGQQSNWSVTSSGSGLLSVWIDFNDNGDWSDAGEQVFADQAVVAGVNALSFTVPITATPTTVITRLRLSTDAGLSFTGLASDGEVEDYALTISEIPVFCGDGEVNQPQEQCDDGNNDAADGCSATCTREDTDCVDDLAVFSDTTNVVEGNGPAVEVTFIHPGWTASIPGATWIWSADPVANPTLDEFSNFTRTFDLGTTVYGGILEIAADNSYQVWVNGVLAAVDATENNFAAKDIYNISPYLVSGTNTIVVEVKNWAGDADPEKNPAGLLYKIQADNVCVAFCGDGEVNQNNETCDDGNLDNNDGCSDACVVEFCGDSVVNNVVEQCDDGNNVSLDGCSDVCVLEYCGDSIVNNVNEQCDDGNSDPNDGCSEVCMSEYCGDGIVHPGVGEQCDDGNTDNDDGCSEACFVETPPRMAYGYGMYYGYGNPNLYTTVNFGYGYGYSGVDGYGYAYDAGDNIYSELSYKAIWDTAGYEPGLYEIGFSATADGNGNKFVYKTFGKLEIEIQAPEPEVEPVSGPATTGGGATGSDGPSGGGSGTVNLLGGSGGGGGGSTGDSDREELSLADGDGFDFGTGSSDASGSGRDFLEEDFLPEDAGFGDDSAGKIVGVADKALIPTTALWIAMLLFLALLGGYVTYRGMNNSGRSYRRFVSVVLTMAILTTLFLIGPAQAVKLFIHSPSDTTPMMDDVVDFIVEIDIQTDEVIPISYVSLDVNGVECRFHVSGGTSYTNDPMCTGFTLQKLHGDWTEVEAQKYGYTGNPEFEGGQTQIDPPTICLGDCIEVI